MKKYFIFPLMVLILFICSSVQAAEFAYHSSEGQFSILFPLKPQAKKASRGEYTAYRLSVEYDDIEYKIIYTVHNKTISKSKQKELLAQTVDVYLKTLQGKVKKESQVKVGKITSKEISFVTQDKRYINYKILFANNTLYTLQVTQFDKFAPKDQMRYFFDSFELD
jgi:hypothetical protein